MGNLTELHIIIRTTGFQIITAHSHFPLSLVSVRVDDVEDLGDALHVCRLIKFSRCHHTSMNETFKIDVHTFVRPPYLIKDWLIRPHAEIFLMDHVYFLIMVFNLNCMISMNRAKLKDLAKIYGICFFLFLGGNTLYKLTSMDVRNVGPVFPGAHWSL